MLVLIIMLVGLGLEVVFGYYLWRYIRHRIQLDVIAFVWQAMEHMRPARRAFIMQAFASKWCPLCGDPVFFDRECPHHAMVPITDTEMN